MLQIEKHEVASGGLQDVAYAGSRELNDEVPELGDLVPAMALRPLPRHSSLPFGCPRYVPTGFSRRLQPHPSQDEAAFDNRLAARRGLLLSRRNGRKCVDSQVHIEGRASHR